nr:hypothetical protein [Tanacetum cinerariifolium]
TDLLGIIHTDVCGPLRHVSRQENQLGKAIKALQSDRSGEYISQEFKDYLKACGIIQQLTPPYTPQYNGVSERRNRTLLDMFFEKNLITQEVSGRAIDLEEIQDEDTSPSEITSEIPMEVKGFEPPQEEVILIRRKKSEKNYSSVRRYVADLFDDPRNG